MLNFSMDFPWISQGFSHVFSQFHLTILEPNTHPAPTDLEVFPGFLGSIPGKLLGLGAPDLDNWIFFNFIYRNLYKWRFLMGFVGKNQGTSSINKGVRGKIMYKWRF